MPCSDWVWPIRRQGDWINRSRSFKPPLADPKDTELLRELGVAYFLSGKMDQAIEILEPSSQRDDLKSLYFLGRAYQEKGEL